LSALRRDAGRRCVAGVDELFWLKSTVTPLAGWPAEEAEENAARPGDSLDRGAEPRSVHRSMCGWILTKEICMGVEDTIREAIEIGERDGVITFDQLSELCGLELEVEDIERVLGALSDAGIRVEDQ
jgi:hypothetical protein